MSAAPPRDGGLLLIERAGAGQGTPGPGQGGGDRAAAIRLDAAGEALLTVGRLPLNDVVLSHPTVSRRHAEVRVVFEGGADAPWAEVTDLGSTIGTFVRQRGAREGGGGARDDGWRRLAPHQPTPLGGTPCQVGPFLLSYQPAYPDVAGLAPDDDPAPVAPPPAPHALPPRAAVDPAPAPRRPVATPAPAATAVCRYLRDLPAIYHEDGADGFLNRMLLIYEGLWEPLEQRQDHIAAYVDPRTCPSAVLPWLAGWLGVTLRADWSDGRRRRLLTEAFELIRWQGTPYALVRLIELATEVTPEVVADDRRACVIRVRLPLAARAARGGAERRAADALTREVESLVRAHKPAHVGYIIEEV